MQIPPELADYNVFDDGKTDIQFMPHQHPYLKGIPSQDIHESFALVFPIEIFKKLPTSWADIRHGKGDHRSLLYYTGLQFLARIIQNKSLGTPPEAGKPRGHTFRLGTDIVQKYEIVTELLVKHIYTDEHSDEPWHQRQRMSRPDIIHDHNIVGFRMFFFVIDPEISMERAIRKQIRYNRKIFAKEREESDDSEDDMDIDTALERGLLEPAIIFPNEQKKSRRGSKKKNSAKKRRKKKDAGNDGSNDDDEHNNPADPADGPPGGGGMYNMDDGAIDDDAEMEAERKKKRKKKNQDFKIKKIQERIFDPRKRGKAGIPKTSVSFNENPRYMYSNIQNAQDVGIMIFDMQLDEPRFVADHRLRDDALTFDVDSLGLHLISPHEAILRSAKLGCHPTQADPSNYFVPTRGAQYAPKPRTTATAEKRCALDTNIDKNLEIMRNLDAQMANDQDLVFANPEMSNGTTDGSSNSSTATTASAAYQSAMDSIARKMAATQLSDSPRSPATTARLRQADDDGQKMIDFFAEPASGAPASSANSDAYAVVVAAAGLAGTAGTGFVGTAESLAGTAESLSGTDLSALDATDQLRAAQARSEADANRAVAEMLKRRENMLCEPAHDFYSDYAVLPDGSVDPDQSHRTVIRDNGVDLPEILNPDLVNPGGNAHHERRHLLPQDWKFRMYHADLAWDIDPKHFSSDGMYDSHFPWIATSREALNQKIMSAILHCSRSGRFDAPYCNALIKNIEDRHYQKHFYQRPGTITEKSMSMSGHKNMTGHDESIFKQSANADYTKDPTSIISKVMLEIRVAIYKIYHTSQARYAYFMACMRQVAMTEMHRVLHKDNSSLPDPLIALLTYLSDNGVKQLATEINIFALDIGMFLNYLQTLLVSYEMDDVSTNHIHMMQVLAAFYSAYLCANSTGCKLKNNTALRGPPGTGKSDCVQREVSYMIPGTIDDITADSAMSKVNIKDQNFKVEVYDESADIYDIANNKLAAPDRKKKRMEVSAMSKGYMRYDAAAIDPQTGKRGVNKFDLEYQHSKIICSNIMRWRKTDAMADRFRDITVMPAFRRGKSIIDFQTAISTVEYHAQQAKIAMQHRRAQAVMMLACVSEKCCFLPTPNLSLLKIRMSQTIDFLEKHAPNSSSRVRLWEMMGTEAMTNVFMYAIHVAFFSELSPFRQCEPNHAYISSMKKSGKYHDDDPKNWSMSIKDFSIEDIAVIGKHLVCTDDVAIRLITDVVYNLLDPMTYKVAFCLALEFGHFDVDEIFEYYDNVEQGYMYEKDDFVAVDTDVLQCTLEGQTAEAIKARMESAMQARPHLRERYGHLFANGKARRMPTAASSGSNQSSSSHVGTDPSSLSHANGGSGSGTPSTKAIVRIPGAGGDDPWDTAGIDLFNSNNYTAASSALHGNGSLAVRDGTGGSRTPSNAPGMLVGGNGDAGDDDSSNLSGSKRKIREQDVPGTAAWYSKNVSYTMRKPINVNERLEKKKGKSKSRNNFDYDEIENARDIIIERKEKESADNDRDGDDDDDGVGEYAREHHKSKKHSLFKRMPKFLTSLSRSYQISTYNTSFIKLDYPMSDLKGMRGRDFCTKYGLDFNTYITVLEGLSHRGVEVRFSPDMPDVYIDNPAYVRYSMAMKMDPTSDLVASASQEALIEDVTGCYLNVDILFENPSRIIEKLVHSFEYHHTRERTVLMGIQDADKPYCMKPVIVKPKPGVYIKTPNVRYASADNLTIMNRGRTINPDIIVDPATRSRFTFIKDDLERWALEHHFKDHGFDPRELEFADPSNVENMVRAIYDQALPEPKMSDQERNDYLAMACHKYAYENGHTDLESPEAMECMENHFHMLEMLCQTALPGTGKEKNTYLGLISYHDLITRDFKDLDKTTNGSVSKAIKSMAVNAMQVMDDALRSSDDDILDSDGMDDVEDARTAQKPSVAAPLAIMGRDVTYDDIINHKEPQRVLVRNSDNNDDFATKINRFIKDRDTETN